MVKMKDITNHPEFEKVLEEMRRESYDRGYREGQLREMKRTQQFLKLMDIAKHEDIKEKVK